MEPSDLFTTVGGGVASGGALLYLAHRALGVAERWLDGRRQRRNGNGEEGGEHGGPPERRGGDRVTHALLRELLTEVRGLRSDTRELNVRTQHVEAGVEAIRRGEGCG